NNKALGKYKYKLILSDSQNSIESNLLEVVIVGKQQTNNYQSTINFMVNLDWGSGADFSIVINNREATNIDKWILEFDFDKKIISVWDCIMTASDNHYKFVNPMWGGLIPSGGKIKFGGICAGNVGTLKPKNIKLNGKLIVVQ
ncbi:MAG: cellulose binding domain-containing protein, partial [Sarcina sp.]